MTIDFINKPTDGALPFINGNGHGYEQIFGLLRAAIKRFSLDRVRMHPERQAHMEGLGIVVAQVLFPSNNSSEEIPILSTPSMLAGLPIEASTNIPLSEMHLYKGDKLCARIVGLPVIPVKREG